MVDTLKGFILYDTGKLVMTEEGACVYHRWESELYPLWVGKVSLTQKDIMRRFWEEKMQTDEYKEWFGDMHYSVVDDLYCDFAMDFPNIIYGGCEDND